MSSLPCATYFRPGCWGAGSLTWRAPCGLANTSAENRVFAGAAAKPIPVLGSRAQRLGIWPRLTFLAIRGGGGLKPLQQLRGLDGPLRRGDGGGPAPGNLIDPKAPNPSVEALLQALFARTPSSTTTHAIALLARPNKRMRPGTLPGVLYGDRSGPWFPYG